MRKFRHMCQDELADHVAKKYRKNPQLVRALQDIAFLRRSISGAALRIDVGPEARAFLQTLLVEEFRFQGNSITQCNRCLKPKTGYDLNCPECKQFEPQELGRKRAEVRDPRSHRDKRVECPLCAGTKSYRAQMCFRCRKKHPTNHRGTAPVHYKLSQEEEQ